MVEEPEIAPDKTALETEGVRLVLNESDNYALEQALMLKESQGAKVTVLAVDSPRVEETLFTALAKGADKAVKVAHPGKSLTTRLMASIFARVIEKEPELSSPDLILTGSRTITDLDRPLAPVLARDLRLPHLGVVSRVSVDFSGRSVTALREYPDGIRGEFEVPLPTVLGIQVAEKPPRYVPVALIRAMMKALWVECIPCPVLERTRVPFQVLELRKPSVSAHVEMLTGSHEVVAHKLRDVLVARGLLEGA
jgi:electron transfer flavoprotein beta subunit